jgi:hypothetical protein
MNHSVGNCPRFGGKLPILPCPIIELIGHHLDVSAMPTNGMALRTVSAAV